MKNVIKINDFLWLAGILEGDGCFSFRGERNRPVLSLSMTDEDVVKRAADIFGASVHVYHPKNHFKSVYETIVSCRKSISFMELLLPYLGQRRQNKINDIFKKYFEYQNNKKISEPERLAPFKEDLLKKYKEEGQTLRSLAKKYNTHPEVIRKTLKSTPRKNPCADFLKISFQNEDIINWVAGLLEAEGSFLKGSPSAPNRPCVSIQMTDEDVIEKVANFFQCSYTSYLPKKKRKDGQNCKQVYSIAVRGVKAVNIMKKIKNLMGVRRQNQIENALKNFNENLKKDAIVKFSSRNKKIFSKDVIDIKNLINEGHSIRLLSRKYGVHHVTILNAIKRYDKK